MTERKPAPRGVVTLDLHDTTPATSESEMRYATHSERRPGLTRDLPHGPEELMWVANTATMIYGDRDAVLVDTFTTIEQNRRLIDWVRSFNRRLTYIYITHGHGDHFFGIRQLLEVFPEARPVATPATVEQARLQGSPDFIDAFWGKLFPGQIPQPQVFPDVLGGETIELEGHLLKVVEAGFTDIAGSTALWVPDLRLVVAGDVAYNDIHQYMAETTAGTRREWVVALERLKALDPAYVVAGHKNPDRSDDPAILDQSIDYMHDFEDLQRQTSTPEELYDAMLGRYPGRLNPGSLWGAAKRAKS